MSTAQEILRRKFHELLSWEKRKRREDVLASALCSSLLAALLLMPFYWLLPANVLRWFVPLPLFFLLVPLLFLRQRWRRRDSANVLLRLDRSLRLDERAVTAWELLERNADRPAALLVLSEAAERLKSFDARMSFRRRRRWQHYAALPLLCLWIGVLWFDIGVRLGPSRQQPALVQTLAHKLREFSRELQQKASGEGLRESLAAGREMEKVAQKGIEAKTADEQFKNELAGISAKLQAMGQPAGKEPSFAMAESRQSLADLKAELEAAQDMLNSSGGAKGGGEPGQQWLDRLAGLPQIRRQLDQQSPGSRSLSQSELRSALDAMDKQVAAELDRRTLLDAQKFLDQMAKQGTGEKTDSNLSVAGRGERDLPADAEKAESSSNLPGSERGTREESAAPAPQLSAGAATRLKGMLGDGTRSGVGFKGKPGSGRSEVAQDQVIANYRRQAEQELNTERVPEALKETIRKYFVSLESNQISETKE